MRISLLLALTCALMRVSAAQDNWLIVSSADANGLFRFDSTSGAFLLRFQNSSVVYPYGVALAGDGDVYTATSDAGNDFVSQINRFDPVTGNLLGAFGALPQTRAMIIGPDGLIYVSAFASDQIWRYDPLTGAFRDVFANVYRPIGLAFGPDGNLYVSSPAAPEANVIVQVNTTTQAISTFVSDPGQDFSTAIAFGPDGNLYVGTAAGTYVGQIRMYSGTTGSFMKVFANIPNNDMATALIFGPDGNLYAGTGAGYVLRYNGTTGTFMDTFIPSGTGGLGSNITGLLFMPIGITATTNLTAATFTIVGPVTYQGNGTIYTQPNALPGQYTITYGAVPGYTTPPPQTQTLAANGTITFTATYTPQPSVQANPLSLTFSYQQGSSVPAPQTSTVSSSGAALTFTAVAGTNAGGGTWLSVSPSSGTTGSASAILSVSVNPVGLAVGTYTGQITIAAPGASNTPLNVPVALAVTQSGSPIISLSAPGINFPDQLVGSPGLGQIVTVTNTGTAAAGISNIGISGPNFTDFTQRTTCAASLSPGTSCTITVVFTPTGTGARSATLAVTDTAAGSPQTALLKGSGLSDAISNLTLVWPIPTNTNRKDLSQGYSEFNAVTKNKYHTGIDIIKSDALAIASVADGQVTEIQLNGGNLGGTCAPPSASGQSSHCADHGFGNTVIVSHILSGKTVYTQYSHMATIAATLLTSCGTPNSINRVVCPKPVPVTGGVTTLGTVGGTGFGQLTYWPIHLHLELKAFGTLGTLGDDKGEFGYTTELPDQVGYYDPAVNLAVVSDLGASLQVVVTSTTNLLVGPGGSAGTGYRVVKGLTVGGIYNALRLSTPTTTPTCAKGWYEIVQPSGTFFPDSLGKGAQLPFAWVCADSVVGQ